MAIVAKRRNFQAVVQAQPSLHKLLIPTEFHPHGRVQINPVTGMVDMPQRNILYMNKIRRRGREIEVEVNGGHAKADKSVWRLALSGPARYFWKLMRDEMMYKLRQTRTISAPVLEDAEMMEARQFVSYLLARKEKGEKALPEDFLNQKYDHGMREKFEEINKGFYDWLKKSSTKIGDLPKITDVFVFLPA